MNRRLVTPIITQLAEIYIRRYIARVNGLTKQEFLVLSVIAGLLLTGLIVKNVRAHQTTAKVSTVQADNK